MNLLRCIAPLMACLFLPAQALDLNAIEPNRWYEISLPIQYRPWGNLQTDGKSLIFYGGVSTPRGGDYCIYQNALYRFDMATQTGGLVKRGNWYCQLGVTVPVALHPENDSEPTPKDRHTYNQFAYSAADTAVYMAHGASGSENHPHDLWRFPFNSGRWEYLGPAPGASASWDLAGELNMIYADGELWFFLNCRDIFVWNVASRAWRTHTVGTDRYAVTPIGARGLYDPVRRRFAFYGSVYTDSPSQWSNQMAFFSKDSLKWSTSTGPVRLQYAAIDYDSKWDRYLLAKGTGNDSVRVFNPSSETWSTVPISGALNTGGQYVEFVYVPGLDVIVNEKEGRFWVARYRPASLGQVKISTAARALTISAQKVIP